jgi:hypothetical protein
MNQPGRAAPAQQKTASGTRWAGAAASVLAEVGAWAAACSVACASAFWQPAKLTRSAEMACTNCGGAMQAA